MKHFSIPGRVALLAVFLGSFTGCGQGSQSDEELFSVLVTVADKPVEHVRVALVSKANRRGSPCFEGVTGYDGRAGMMQVEGIPLPVEPTEYVAFCEALGDWQIVGPSANPEKSVFTFTWPQETGAQPPFRIDLPKKAIRPL